MKIINGKQITMIMLAVLLMMLSATAVLASGGGSLPWEGPLTKVSESLSGPVAKGMSVVAIVGCGLGIAFGEGGQGMKKLLWVIIGVAISLLAASVITGAGISAGLAF